MPWFGYRRRNRSAEARERAALATARQHDSWERMKAAVAAKYQPTDPHTSHGNGSNDAR